MSEQNKKLHTWYIHVQVGEFIFNIHNLFINNSNSKPIKSQERVIHTFVCKKAFWNPKAQR